MAADPPFELRTADQILAMPDSGEFLAQFMDDHKQLILDMHQAQMDQGGKVKGGFTITVDYTLDRQLSLIVTAEAKIKAAETVYKEDRADAREKIKQDGETKRELMRSTAKVHVEELERDLLCIY